MFVFLAGLVTINGHLKKEDSRSSMYGDPGTPDMNEVRVSLHDFQSGMGWAALAMQKEVE